MCRGFCHSGYGGNGSPFDNFVEVGIVKSVAGAEGSLLESAGEDGIREVEIPDAACLLTLLESIRNSDRPVSFNPRTPERVIHAHGRKRNRRYRITFLLPVSNLKPTHKGNHNETAARAKARHQVPSSVVVSLLSHSEAIF